MTSTTARPPRRRDLVGTRTALLDAAADVFARRGFSGASLDEIAEVAGFTRGAVHHHFSSKEDLFLSVIARRDEQLLAGYADILDSTPSDAVTGAARWSELHPAGDDDVALRLELRAHALRSPALRGQLLAVERAASAATAERLREISQENATTWRCPVEHVAELFHAASRAAAERAAVTGEDSEALMKSWLDVIWRGATARPPKEE